MPQAESKPTVKLPPGHTWGVEEDALSWMDFTGLDRRQSGTFTRCFPFLIAGGLPFEPPAQGAYYSLDPCSSLLRVHPSIPRAGRPAVVYEVKVRVYQPHQAAGILNSFRKPSSPSQFSLMTPVRGLGSLTRLTGAILSVSKFSNMRVAARTVEPSRNPL